MRSRVPGNESSPTLSRSAGLFVEKISCFHCHMQRAADGIPDETDAPAPKNKQTGLVRLIATDRTKASIRSEWVSSEVISVRWEHAVAFGEISRPLTHEAVSNSRSAVSVPCPAEGMDRAQVRSCLCSRFGRRGPLSLVRRHLHDVASA